MVKHIQYGITTSQILIFVAIFNIKIIKVTAVTDHVQFYFLKALKGQFKCKASHDNIIKTN